MRRHDMMNDENVGSSEDIQNNLETYTHHLGTVTRVFNQHAEELGLGVRLDPTNAINAVKSGTGFSRVMRFCDRPDDCKSLHNFTAHDSTKLRWRVADITQEQRPRFGCHAIRQATTSIALQFAGPIVYLLTGRRLAPIYLITSHTSQEDQTKIEITRFLDFYGELTVEIDETNRCSIIEYVRQYPRRTFVFLSTINTYREHVLKRALPDTMVGPRLAISFNAVSLAKALEKWLIFAAGQIARVSLLYS